jgi:P-type conjugative transfer protein TrbG
MSMRIFHLALIFALAASFPTFAQAQRAEPGANLLSEANRAARQGPSTNTFDRARQIHAYAPGAIYEIYTNPSFVSAILLEPGEELAEAAAGDTSRWLVSQAVSRAQGALRTIVLVKPSAAGLRTNIVLITDRRVYLIEAVSQSGRTYSAELAWTYPADETLAPHVADAHLNSNYRIRTRAGRRPVWLPARVYDDGRRTWIEFPAAARSSELPPLFLVGANGPELINYRTQDGDGALRYVVDRVFDAAELRLGARHPVVVRIERGPRPARARRSQP